MKVTYDRLVPRGCRYVINGELVTSDRTLVDQGTIDDELVKDLQRYTIDVPPTEAEKRQRRIACIAGMVQVYGRHLLISMGHASGLEFPELAEVIAGKCLDELEKIG